MATDNDPERETRGISLTIVDSGSCRTVGELREQLDGLPPGLEVYVVGWGSNARIVNAEVGEKDGTAVLFLYPGNDDIDAATGSGPSRT